ncbi:MAG: MgtC/SapB family protein [Chloroflexota bacterium]|nr:MAG: MgtC/SapB family protein [Chloroflexota bacterium]
MTLQPEDLIKLLLAVAAGGLIGLEREYRDKAAGFRTLIFICVGACLFTIFSGRLAGDNDPTRIAANIVSGVGFLGAGVILRDGGRVIGLTTASTVWLTAALGMGLGGGQYALAGAAVLLSLVVLWVFPRLEHWIDSVREERTYEVVCGINPAKFIALEDDFRRCGLHIRTHRQVKSGSEMTCSWQASGSLKAHEGLMKLLFSDEEVKEFRF